jgi:hypothetical protein
MSTQPKLLDRVRDRLRYKQYTLRTEQAYVNPGLVGSPVDGHASRCPQSSVGSNRSSWGEGRI